MRKGWTTPTKVNYDSVLLILIFAFINCFITFVVGTIIVLVATPSKTRLRLWGWIGILFVSLLSMTKIPESDLEWIVEHFHLAKLMSYSDYLLLLGKEPLYQSFSYAMHYILIDNEKLFIFILSFISMSLLYISFYTFCEKIRVNKYIYIMGVYLMLFFPFFFGMPVHLVRQTMAMSLILFVFTNKICNNRFYWPLALCAPLIHSTTILCLPILFLGLFKKPFNFKSIIYFCIIGAVFFFIQKIATYLLLFVGNSGTITYALTRASQDTVHETRVVGYQIFITYLIGFVLFYLNWKNKRLLHFHEEINSFSSFIILIIIFIFSATGQDELQMRFISLIWQFLSLIVCVILKLYKINDVLITLFCAVIFLVWWFYELYYTPFTFKGIGSFWYYSFFNYYSI